ncbi:MULTISPECIES: TetR/AcrR family transcriptional regulator [Nitratireductor]|uniref:TetR/AcrR family transcriptional regulator n=1 Tax=Nitratireductor TaxID=245876 RepID=UPI000D0D480D|nr:MULTISPECIES: TetR/AcrR family transcriptional regulator [Nitratireductor]PSM18076.1 TetR/AcrR family transcriptional regulator [Nitratireductor sp. StC3]
MAPRRPSSRAKILKAAADVAREAGIGHFSLDAVAARAGLSKGGLLYNFPSKSKLLEALVEEHLIEVEAELSDHAARRAGSPNALATAFLALARDQDRPQDQPPSGLLAALAEDPGFLEPVLRFHRHTLTRMTATASDPHMVLVAFLAVEGLRLTRLLGLDVLDASERASAYAKLESLLAATTPA